VLAFHSVPHRAVEDDVVAVTAPFSMPREAASGFEVFHDALDRSLGDTDLISQVAEPKLGIAGQADEHMTVITQERPVALDHRRILRRIANKVSWSHELTLGTVAPELNFC
jgi:hypothetical protein